MARRVEEKKKKDIQEYLGELREEIEKVSGAAQHILDSRVSMDTITLLIQNHTMTARGGKVPRSTIQAVLEVAAELSDRCMKEED